MFRSEFVVYHHQYIRTLVDFRFTKHATIQLGCDFNVCKERGEAKRVEGGTGSRMAKERVMFGEPNLSKRGKHGKPTNAHDDSQGLRKACKKRIRLKIRSSLVVHGATLELEISDGGLKRDVT